MGYMRHHAIVVTGYKRETVKTARTVAVEAGLNPTPLINSPVNGYVSFFIPPDGSKEGWTDSEMGDARRAALIEYLDTQRFEDGGSFLDWVEVQYGDDERVTMVTAHNDEDFRTSGDDDE